MSALPNGAVLEVPDLPGRWAVWSQSNEAPGAHYLVPADDDALTYGCTYIVVTAIRKISEPGPVIKLLRDGEPTRAGRAGGG